MASARWAIEGGLNEESSMNSVFGDDSATGELRGWRPGGCTVRTMRKVEGEDVKDWMVDRNSGSALRIDAIRSCPSFMFMLL